jgi:hypothetical protein
MNDRGWDAPVPESQLQQAFGHQGSPIAGLPDVTVLLSRG